MRRIAYHFGQTVGAGASAQIVQGVQGEGTVTGLKVFMPPGPAGTLHLDPYVLSAEGVRVDLVAYAGPVKYLAGDDFLLTLAPREPVSLQTGDRLIVSAVNTGLNPHEFFVVIEVDYAVLGVTGAVKAIG